MTRQDVLDLIVKHAPSKEYQDFWHNTLINEWAINDRTDNAFNVGQIVLIQIASPFGVKEVNIETKATIVQCDYASRIAIVHYFNIEQSRTEYKKIPFSDLKIDESK